MSSHTKTGISALHKSTHYTQTKLQDGVLKGGHPIEHITRFFITFRKEDEKDEMKTMYLFLWKKCCVGALTRTSRREVGSCEFRDCKMRHADCLSIEQLARRAAPPESKFSNAAEARFSRGFRKYKRAPPQPHQRNRRF